MKVLIVGAAGFIGAKLTEYVLNSPDYDYIVAVDREDIAPGFTDTSERKWLQKNTDEANRTWWLNTIESNSIEQVFWLDTLENINIFIPTEDYLRQLTLSEMYFNEYLEQRVNAIQLKVVFLSTDKLYKLDYYPWESENIHLPSVDKMEAFDRYSLLKVSTESKLLTTGKNGGINPRIIRPFALSGAGQSLEYPLPKMIKRFLDESSEDLQNGISYSETEHRGLTFTHIDDLIDFMVCENLFDNLVEQALVTKVLNFCRVWNYLTEIQLLEKIKNKTESVLGLVGAVDTINFPGIQYTPGIQNMKIVTKNNIPTRNIEMLLEDIIYHYEPQNAYAPLTVDSISWDPASIPTISGTVEPLASVGIYFGDGTESTVDSDANGLWSITKDTDLTFDSTWYIFATTATDNQYQTLSILVPSPGNP